MRGNKKIKVLFRHRSMEMGGVEKVMLSLMNNLDQNKFEIAICLNLNQGELRNEIPKNVRKIHLAEGREDLSKNYFLEKIQLLNRRRKLGNLLKNPRLVDELYIKEKYDIEIAMTYNDFDLVLNSTNNESKKIAWFHSEINVAKLQPLVPKILEHFPQFDHIVYCSQKIKEMMHLHYPDLKYPEESVIINAIPAAEIKKKVDEEIGKFTNKPVFVSVGRLHSRKGYHKLMHAHAQLLEEGFSHSVLVIGDGEEWPNLVAQQKELGVEKTFILKGNKMNPYPYIKNADFFIMPSESEAWPLVIAEALILQKPIIATDVGDVGLMIEHKKTGFLINYKTLEIQNAMKAFLTDEDLVDSIRMNLVDSENQYDGKKIFSEIETMLLKTLNS